ncbi:sensor histidine kinase [Nonomuraea spiralis]|uniref:sensor histidine kinase n=1 Tax=Nonomuraea spiralis TaxID=46182 RepID=UPI00379388D9
MRRNLPRRWACLVLGGALLMPYMMAGVLVAGMWHGGAADLLMPIQVGVFVAVLPVVALTGLFLPVRGLEVNAAQGLLGARVETPPRQSRRSWQERRRTAAWFTLHLAVGGVVSGFTLAVVPFTAFTLVLPFLGEPMPVLGVTAEPGWPSVLWSVAGVTALALLVAVAAGAGALLAALASPLLGPTPAERLAAAEEHARTLAERNRLARELHDSVGHALSVVTLQAAAAGRVLDRDPATARTALAAIEQSARAALEDLDHVLGVLREDVRGQDVRGQDRRGGDRHGEDPDGGRRAPQATLADLGTLVAASGAEVRQEVGDLSGVPAVVSREAYRILQEALTNAIKHGHGPVRLAAAVQGDDLRLEVSNPGAARDRGRGGGRGVRGMRERVRLLRGDLRAGPDEGGWTVSVRLPLRSSP